MAFRETHGGAERDSRLWYTKRKMFLIDSKLKRKQ